MEWQNDDNVEQQLFQPLVLKAVFHQSSDCEIKGQCFLLCRHWLRRWMHRTVVSVGWTSTRHRSCPAPLWVLRAESNMLANWEPSTWAGAKWVESALTPCLCLDLTPRPGVYIWSLILQVTNELLDKVGEVEANLQGHAQFQDRMERLSDWVVITHQTIITRGLNPGQAQVDWPWSPKTTKEQTLLTCRSLHCDAN